MDAFRNLTTDPVPVSNPTSSVLCGNLNELSHLILTYTPSPRWLMQCKSIVHIWVNVGEMSNKKGQTALSACWRLRFAFSWLLQIQANRSCNHYIWTWQSPALVIHYIIHFYMLLTHASPQHLAINCLLIKFNRLKSTRFCWDYETHKTTLKA